MPSLALELAAYMRWVYLNQHRLVAMDEADEYAKRMLNKKLGIEFNSKFGQLVMLAYALKDEQVDHFLQLNGGSVMVQNFCKSLNLPFPPDAASWPIPDSHLKY
jgi:hypothetical protein